MAKKQQNETRPIEHVTCEGCMFIKPYEDFKGHGFCTEIHVRMIQIIKSTKQCIWKQHGEKK